MAIGVIELHHNAAIEQYGRCSCPCHEKGKPCYCAAPDWMKAPVKSRKPRTGKLTSRVKAFTAARLVKGRVGLATHMAVSKAHYTHALRTLNNSAKD